MKIDHHGAIGYLLAIGIADGVLAAIFLAFATILVVAKLAGAR